MMVGVRLTFYFYLNYLDMQLIALVANMICKPLE
jgi:hypothetical protein